MDKKLETFQISFVPANKVNSVRNEKFKKISVNPVCELKMFLEY